MTLRELFAWVKKITENGKKDKIFSKDNKLALDIIAMRDGGEIIIDIRECDMKSPTLMFCCIEGKSMIVDCTDQFTLLFCPIGLDDPMPKSITEYIQSNFMEEKSMKKIYLANAFSIQMLDKKRISEVSFRTIDANIAKKVLSNGFISAIGHADTAKVVGTMLGLDVQANRISITPEPDDEIIVAQLSGGRLPEGTTEIPEGMNIDFWRVHILAAI